MRRPFIAGNWKMNLTGRQARALATEIRDAVRGVTDRDTVLFPTFLSITEVATMLDGSNLKVGGQDCHFESDGAYTGEVSASLLRAAGATHVILGHSERRHILGESDATVNRKVIAALANGLLPVLCVGEKLEEREAGMTESVLERQLSAGLAGVQRDDVRRLTLAYEPVWAIGTGKTATPDIAQAAHVFLRARLAALYDRQTSADVRIQYGGSVKPNNIDELMAMPDIDGALVGGASLEAANFVRIVKFAAR